MKLHTVIVDDEENGAESLSLLIAEYCPALQVKAMAHHVEDAVAAIEQHKPAIVFLDIEMPVGSGFDVIRKTPGFSYKIIFTTAHRNYALEALKLEAIDYLLKPIGADELVAAVDKAMQRITGNTDMERLADLFRQLQVKLRSTRISIPGNEGFVMIDVDNLVRLEADSNYTHVYCTDGKKMTVSKTLKDFESTLDPVVFFRLHHKHIINLNKVERYIRGDGGYVMLKDGSSVPVSRSRKSEFLDLFGGNRV
jgi:two-component system LytT family response regulator